MAEPATKLPTQNQANAPARSTRDWNPFESLRREIDRLFDQPFRMFDVDPWRSELKLGKQPAVDVAETETAYEITAELPGIEEKDINVNLSDGVLTIKGEKKVEREEKKKDYYLSERSYGSFQRAFQIPESVDPDKIEASFKNGVLKLHLPKTPAAQKAQKKIEIKKG